MTGLPGSTGWSWRQGTPPRRRPRGMCQLTVLGWWPRSAGAGIPWQQLQARAQTPACIEQQRANPDYPITILLRSITWCVTRLSSHGSEVARLHPTLKVVTQQILANAVHMNCSLLLQDCCKFYLGGRILLPCRQQADSTVRAALAFAHSLRRVHACQAYGDASMTCLANADNFLAS